MSDPIRSVTTSPAYNTRWVASTFSGSEAALPGETLTLGEHPTLLANLQQTRTSGDSTGLPPSSVVARIPASMIGGIGGYVVGLVSGQTLSLPAVRDVEVIPDGESALLKLAVQGTVASDSQLVLTNSGTAAARFLPTMIAVAPTEAPPPPPRPSLEHVVPMNPGSLNPPPDVLEALRNSKRVLVVCHTPPDGDTAGSGLGMRRLLASLGKQADLFLDGPLPGWMRDQAAPGEFSSWEHVQAQDYDTVVVLDVAQSHRIGRAASIVASAPVAVVLDHHDKVPTSESLGREGPIVSWVAQADATAMLVASVAEKLEPPCWDGIASPLVTGILTDTEFFAKPVRPETGPVLKHLLEVRGAGLLEAACRRVEARVAEEAQGLLSEPMSFRGEMLRPEAEALRQAALAQSMAYHEEQVGDMALVVVPRSSTQVATKAGQLSDPGTNRADLQDVFYSRLNSFEKPLAVMLWEHPEHVHISIRSQEPLEAIELARTLGGGGKPHQAAAVSNRPLSELVDEIRQWGIRP